MIPDLKVKRLDPRAFLPTCKRPGEDIAWDLYAMEDVVLYPSSVTRISTGVAVEMNGYGFLIGERSGMSLEGIFTVGGRIDAGYRGEMFVQLAYLPQRQPYPIKYGDRIAQFVPIKVATSGKVREVAELSQSIRGTLGYGSSGR